MKRTVWVAVVAMGLVAAWAVADDKAPGGCPGGCCGAKACAAPAEKCAAAEAKCPISGKKISKDAAVDYKGGKLYFCCPGCTSGFQAEKAKYETKANEQLVATGQAKQKSCPLSGGEVDPSTKIQVDGIDVAFCCSKCQAKVKNAAPDKQRELVFGKGFDKAFEVKKQ